MTLKATGYPERVKKAMEMGLLGRQELEQSARRVLELILKIVILYKKSKK